MDARKLGDFQKGTPCGCPSSGSPPGRTSESSPRWPGEVCRCERTTSTPRAAAASTMAALGRRYPGEQVRANPCANQTFANPASAQRSRGPGPPVAFARLRMAVSERLCWRPGRYRPPSRRGVGLDQPRAHAREGCEPPGSAIEAYNSPADILASHRRARFSR